MSPRTWNAKSPLPCPKPERKDFSDAVAAHRAEAKDGLSPAQRDETFAVPALMAVVQGELEIAETDTFMENHDWSLLDHPARFSEDDFAVRETAQIYEIDLDGRAVAFRIAGKEEQLALDVDVEGWTPQALVLWLDRAVRSADIGQQELLRWLSDLVGHLVDVRGLHIAALMRGKFLLARKIRNEIAAIRVKESKAVYRQYLFDPGAKPEVSFDTAFRFRDGIYRDRPRYRGRWRPQKHFLEYVPAFDGAEDGEETQCAKALESLREVRFWLRNVARDPASFWLPTAAGKFYPDFVALLEDGRLLVAEYKGARDIKSDDTREKKTIGDLWESKSGGKGLFIVVEKSKDGKDMRAQLADKIA